jgi:hypothetical protein
VLDSSGFGQTCSQAAPRQVWIFSLTCNPNALKSNHLFKAGGGTKMQGISRRALALLITVSAWLPGAALAADALKEIRIDWATYNPVSLVLKQKGLLEKEFA